MGPGVSRESLDSLIRKLVAEGASRDTIWRMLEMKLSEAEKRGTGDSPRCQRIRRIQFYVRTRLVPRNTSAADMKIFRLLQKLR
jgi:hypothetical protein